MLHRFIFGLLVLIPVSLVSANSVSGNFLQQRALDPIKQLTGLPAAASRLTTTSELQVEFVHNNVFMGGLTQDERLVLDGESSQLSLRYRRQINSCWQFNIDGTLLAHSTGLFDRPVDEFHQFFGLPDAMRDEVPDNQLEYTYQGPNGSQSLTSSAQGFGDVQLQAQRNLGCATNAPILRVGVKLPIGETDQFLSSGELDAFIDLQSPWKKIRPSSRWMWAGSIGLLTVGETDFLAEPESVIGFGVAGLNFSISPNLKLLGQLDWHTPIFKSELRELGSSALQISLGLRYQTRSKGAWEISFSEDAAIDTAPDIAVRLAWVSRFDALSSLK